VVADPAAARSYRHSAGNVGCAAAGASHTAALRQQFFALFVFFCGHEIILPASARAVRVNGILAARRGHERPASSGAAWVNATSEPGSVCRQAGNPYATGNTDSLPTSNPAQIGMAAKPDAHHVVDFALVPVRRAPHANDGRQFGFSSLTPVSAAIRNCPRGGADDKRASSAGLRRSCRGC